MPSGDSVWVCVHNKRKYDGGGTDMFESHTTLVLLIMHVSYDGSTDLCPVGK